MVLALPRNTSSAGMAPLNDQILPHYYTHFYCHQLLLSASPIHLHRLALSWGRRPRSRRIGPLPALDTTATHPFPVRLPNLPLFRATGWKITPLRPPPFPFKGPPREVVRATAFAALCPIRPWPASRTTVAHRLSTPPVFCRRANTSVAHPRIFLVSRIPKCR